MTKYRCESVTDPVSGKVFIEVFYPTDAEQVFRTSPAHFATHEDAEKQFKEFAGEVLPDFAQLPADPSNNGWVLGFAVVSNSPWHFGGIYTSQDEAERIAGHLGGSYEVRYGSHQIDSDNFVAVNR
ncbi:hypothetical protein [Burkholderia sp. Bp9004]|uniref:hypothetical protein n=1 Tax=Burkholderia sp. Bp9004 TaxID=2184559 RepID=UPI001C8A6265|nr:hypothetical protein [Burkholderia sp. Bp9004]